MLALIPDASAELSIVTRAGDTSLMVQLRTHGPSADLLASFETVIAPMLEARSDIEWVEPDLPVQMFASPVGGDIGFGSRPTTNRNWLPDEGVDTDAVGRFFAALHAWPGGSLSIQMQCVGKDTFRGSVAVLGPSTPTLRLQAALLEILPGMTLRAGDAPESFTCDAQAASTMMILPLAEPEVPAGILAAPPAMLPIRYMSSTFGKSPLQPENSVRLGWATTDSGTRSDVVLTEQELLRHAHVVGSTGTGKSTLLAAMVSQIAASGHGALVLDPHGHLVDRILSELPDGPALESCLVVRADDMENPVPLNPLAGDSPDAVETAISDIGAMFYELFDPSHSGIVGPRFEDRLGQALRSLVVLRGERASLLDVPLMLSHKGMRRAMLLKNTDPRVAAWWDNDAVSASRSNEYGDLVSWVNSKFERFSASPALRRILATGADAYDPIGAMDDGRLILVDLAKGQLGEQASRLLGYLLLNRFWSAALNRQSTERFHVIVDEAHSVMAGALTNMLSEGRKFGLAVTVAHQFLGQLAPPTTEALAGNVATKISFRSSGADVKDQVLASGGLIDPRTLSQLPNFAALALRSVGETVLPAPHTVIIDHSHSGVGQDLDHIREAELRTRRALKDVLKGVTPLDPADYPSAERSVATRPRPRPAGNSSFLDEWLAKRDEAKKEAESAAAKESDDSDGN